MSDRSIPGYDVPAVEAWISANIDGLEPPFVWTRLEGGHSNLTYALVDQLGRRAVVRRPPEGELLPKAHDMGREFRVISGLNKTDVPVPIAHGYCEDPSVTGAHFYVMSAVEGKALYNRADAMEHLTETARNQVGRSFIDTLAKLHAVDPEAVGLGDLGRPDGYVARQLKTWYGSWTMSADAADYDDPLVHELHEHLVSNLPEQGPARVVHGDFGLHNAMFGTDGNVTAVLDWEIATLGDPLADFAYALNAWGEPGSPDALAPDGPTQAPGFLPPEALVERYAERSARDLAQLAYYRTFNHFKTACILHGVYARYRMGQKSTEGVDMDGLKTRMIAALQRAGTTA
jgi:aminoglycoside phosphotransferase (APT) family kinase protein